MPVDPSAVKTWANLVTVSRGILAPFMFILIPDEPGGAWGAFALWFVLCLSDFIDGYLARRHGATNLGAFIDPLADKVLVIGAMIFLVRNDTFALIPVVIITAREVIIVLYRTFVGAKGVSVPASRLAKWKTLTQQLAVGFAILPLTALDAKWLWNGLLWISVVLAVVSGAQYLMSANRVRGANLAPHDATV
ncbi:MAG TPA: CDP-diacylglycerol--glycerol-3-phosphate 3-phosphatidyltransferase [Ilumatobacteraceae bacterium]|nr:CDP-diacylglycerol--glycerol-3-phosphate 3-phosphatidyltransferase [Ilumatobacteraceae bacterium]HUC32859.1 CDP-diacylglycerol--glycerol-3-phosphate 3-phosphatidyltransferase [Ilumatobacteraceae bacterium]